MLLRVLDFLSIYILDKLNKNMRNWLALVLCLFITEFGYGQKKNDENVSSENIIQPNRIEFEIGPKDGQFQIIPADDNGMLVVNPTRSRNKDKYEWQFYLLDSTLNVVWKRNYDISINTNFLGYDHSGESFYMLFGKSQYKLEKMEVMELSAVSGDSTQYTIDTVFPMQLGFFESLGNTLIFGGYANFRPVVMLFDTEKRKPKVLPGFYNSKSDILDIQTNDESKHFTVMLRETTIKKKITISLRTFQTNGEILVTKKLDAEYEKSLIDGVSTFFKSGVQYVTGTYARRKSEYSRGLYIAKLNRGEQELIKYHNYADLNNFFSYMRAKRETRVKERITRRKVKGKKVKFNYRLLVHDIIQRGEEYVLIGEAYYPKYSSGGSNYYSGAVEGNTDWINPNFLGFRYTHAVVVGFDKNGEVLWDNSFEINDILSYDLKKYVNVSVEKDKIVLIYSYEDVIRAKVIQGNEILEGKSFNPIELTFQSDEIDETNAEMEGLEKWYDNYFYAYGIQRIKNMKDSNVKLNRKVFYINKISYK